MRRRELVALLGVAAFVATSTAAGQEPGKPRRIGFLGNSTEALEAHLVGAFRDGLRDLGYVEGRNIAIEYRWAEGQYEQLTPLIAELAASKVEVIVTAGTPAALAVRRTAPSIPLVMVAVGDPIGTGLAASLAQPGGNATGLPSLAPDLEGKRLELIREMLPNVSRLAVFWNPLRQPPRSRAQRQQVATLKLIGQDI
jgi:putative ABC transport system substrate-binding protein